MNTVFDMKNPETGKTYRQENLEKQHQIPIGTLVEVRFDDWFGAGCKPYQHDVPPE